MPVILLSPLKKDRKCDSSMVVVVVVVAAVVVEVVMRVVVALVSWIASSQYLASIYPEMPQIFSENQRN